MSKGKRDGEETSWERWNTHETTQVEQEVFGTTLRLIQNPSSEHLGTTVWDASIVLAKFFERNIRKGDFARAKVRGKRCIELGAGMGLGGMAFAMVGANVVLTDVAEIVPMLKINVEKNLNPAAVRMQKGGTWADSAGTVSVAELDWYKPEQVEALNPPYDYVLAADCIYHEHIVEHFHRIVMMLTNDKSTVAVCNELRSQTVHARFMELFTATHTIKVVPKKQLHEVYQHPNINIFVMRKKKPPGAKKGAGEDDDEDNEDGGAEAEEAAPSAAADGASTSTIATDASREDVRNGVEGVSGMDQGAAAPAAAASTTDAGSSSRGADGQDGHQPGAAQPASDSLQSAADDLKKLNL